MLTKIIFILMIIICAAFYVLYIWDFSLVLLIVIASIPPLMFIMLFITKKLIKAEFSISEKTASKNENFHIHICVNNRSIFPIGKAEAYIEYYNVFNNEINVLDLHFPIQSRNSHCLTFQLSSKFCGIIKLCCVEIAIYDPLRIFKFKIGKKLKQTIVILPEGHDITAFLGSSDRTNDESNVFSEHKPGDDPSEVFELRDYHPGDKLNRIHWKLSSKKNDFIVKEYSLPIDSPTKIFLDLNCTEDSEYTLPLYDTLLETLVSLSQFMLENERFHTIVYYNASKQQFVEQNIDSIDTLAASICELIMSIRDDLACEKPEAYFAEYSNSGCASFIFITAEENDNLLSYIDEEVNADLKNAVIIVKDEHSAGFSSNAFNILRVSPVFIGRISSSIRDIEI